MAWALSVVMWSLLVPVTSGAPASPARRDPRTVTLLEYRCSSDLTHRIVTLYANGTVRLREDLGDGERLDLAELTPEELAGYVAQLHARDPSDGLLREDLGAGVGGLHVEQCDLQVAPPGQQTVHYHFSPLEARTLRYARWVAMAEALAQRARPKPVVEALGEDYQPHLDDVLRDRVGNRYKVVWVGVDDWLELDGIEQPFHLLLHRSQLGERFVALVTPGSNPP